MTQQMFTDARAALQFIEGGNSIVTLRSTKTGVRYTFRIRRSDDGKLFFVSFLTGSNNESDYSYVGIIRDEERTDLRLTAKSKLTADSLPVRGFRYTLGALIHGLLPPGVEIWHEGRCGRCGRTLTVPESLASGFGPECAQKVAA